METTKFPPLEHQSQVDIDGKGFAFHGAVPGRVARLMLFVMVAEHTAIEQEKIFMPDGGGALHVEGGEIIPAQLTADERDLYVRGVACSGELEAYKMVLERRDPETWYYPRLLRMKRSNRPAFARIARERGRAAALIAMHEAVLLKESA